MEDGGRSDHECGEHRETMMEFSGEGTVTFDNALSTFARLVSARLGEHALDDHRFVRDVDGRLTFLLLDPADPEKVRSLDAESRDVLGSYATVPAVAVAGDLLDPSLADDFAVQEQVDIAAPGADPEWRRVAVVDRRIVGQDWAIGWQGPIPGVPPILAFHSIEGGVGRSSAVAVLAAYQAERGRNVLVVDLDLEAPGIGALLLAREDLPQLGVLDWLVETSLRPDAEGDLIQRCVGQSRLTRGRGAVDVLPALGRSAGKAPWTVVPKLGRGFIDHPSLGHSHLERIRRLVALTCNEGTRHYDVVLVDARAGLAESSAAALLGLGATVLCFGVDGPATQDGYRLLFSYLAGLDDAPGQHDTTDQDWRDRFRMVHAKARAGADARQVFRERMYEVFVDAVYDTDDAGDAGTDRSGAAAAFSFDYDDEDAPHWAWPIAFELALAELDPHTHPNRLTSEFVDRTFGSFLMRVDRMIVDASG